MAMDMSNHDMMHIEVPRQVDVVWKAGEIHPGYFMLCNRCYRLELRSQKQEDETVYIRVRVIHAGDGECE